MVVLSGGFPPDARIRDPSGNIGKTGARAGGDPVLR